MMEIGNGHEVVSSQQPGKAPTSAATSVVESKRMKRLRTVMRKALSTTVNAMLTPDLQKCFESLKPRVDDETFQVLISTEKQVVEEFKEYTEKEFEEACSDYKLNEKFVELDQLIQKAAVAASNSNSSSNGHAPAANVPTTVGGQAEGGESSNGGTTAMDVMVTEEEDPEDVLKACRVQEKMQERAILKQYLAQETQGLKGREEKLSETMAQVEAVVKQLSGFTNRLEEAMKQQQGPN